jgi:hypothetical protein
MTVIGQSGSRASISAQSFFARSVGIVEEPVRLSVELAPPDFVVLLQHASLDQNVPVESARQNAQAVVKQTKLLVAAHPGAPEVARLISTISASNPTTITSAL